jgi:DNA-binding transcriptional LysR family regulator
LLPRARKLVRQSIELQELISSNSETIAGHLRIACSTTAGKYILPQLAARFCNRFPNIHVSILACTPENIATKLLEENANLAVVSSEHIGTGLEVQEFFTDTIDLVVPAVHPWTSKPYIEPQDLLEEKLIIREVTSGTRRVMVDEFAKHDIALDDLNIFLELGNAEAIVYTVGAGYGVSFVSRLAISFPLAHGYVATVPINGWHLKRTIYMVRKEIRSVNRVQEVFWGFIHDPENADLLSLPGSY